MTTDERLEKMEAQLAHVRLINRCLVTGAVVCVAVWGLTETFGPERTWAQSGVKEVRASSFVVEDKDHRGTAVLAHFGEVGPGLVLMDEKNIPRVSVMLKTSMPSIEFRDENRERRAEFALTKQGPVLSLSNRSANCLVELSIGEKGSGLTLRDEEGRTRLTLGLRNAGPWKIPAMSLWDDKGTPRASLFMAEGPTLTLNDEKGKLVWKAP